jgi:murein DD-endopeptidase MepM/ murein hydrolase activator NlpD
LVIDHGKGWESQYCHLAKASLRASPGDAVVAGQPIGQIGMSGASEFPHLHLTIRHRGKVVDPFAASLNAGDCDPLATKARADNLWEPSARAALSYRAGTILNAGFTVGPIDMRMIEDGTVPAVDHGAPALVAYVRSIGLQAGDVLALTLIGPDGTMLAERRESPLVQARAQSLIFAGRKRPSNGWAPGPYRATFSIKRGDAVALQTEFVIVPISGGK